MSKIFAVGNLSWGSILLNSSIDRYYGCVIFIEGCLLCNNNLLCNLKFW